MYNDLKRISPKNMRGLGSILRSITNLAVASHLHSLILVPEVKKHFHPPHESGSNRLSYLQIIKISTEHLLVFETIRKHCNIINNNTNILSSLRCYQYCSFIETRITFWTQPPPFNFISFDHTSLIKSDNKQQNKYIIYCIHRRRHHHVAYSIH